MREVKWKYRDGRDGEYAEHYHGEFVVTVQDMDGDGTEGDVWLKDDLEKARKERAAGNERAHASPIAKGYVCVRALEDFAVGCEVAIEALDAILRVMNQRASQRRGSNQ